MNAAMSDPSVLRSQFMSDSMVCAGLVRETKSEDPAAD